MTLVQISALSSHASAMPPAPTPHHSAGEPRRSRLLVRVCVRPQLRATRQASSTSRCAVTPLREDTSLRTMKIACSKSSVSGESTTMTRLDVPLTNVQHLPAENVLRPVCPARRALYRGAQNFPPRSHLLQAPAVPRKIQRKNARVVRPAAAVQAVGQNCGDELLGVLPLPARKQVLQPLVVRAVGHAVGHHDEKTPR